MRLQPLPLILAAALTLAASAASAATYYVSTTGNNTNNGALSTPWRDIQYGINHLAAGDTLYVRGGTYNETAITVWGKTSPGHSWYYILPYPNEKPVIDGTPIPGITPGNGIVAIGGGSEYVDFEGFEVKNGANAGILVYNASNLYLAWNDVHDNNSSGIAVTSSTSNPIGTTHDVTVEGCSVHHNVLQNQSLNASSWQQGLSTWRATYVTFKDNYVYENFGEGLDFVCSTNVTAIGNEIWDNFSVDLYLDNARYVTLDHNFIITGWSTSPSSYYRGGNPAAGIEAANENYTSGQNTLDHLTITNNIVVFCQFGFAYSNREYGGGLHNTIISNNDFIQTTDLLLYIENGTTNVHDTTTVENNIFRGRSTVNYSYATSTAITYRTNCWYGGVANTQKSGTGDVLSNPLFVNDGGYDAIDYKLLNSTSPCINAGTTESAVTKDFWNASRSGVYDIGAHEF